MKKLALLLLFAGLQAAAQNSTSTAIEVDDYALDPANSIEAGLQMHSINNGSEFLGIALTHDFGNRAVIGVRGAMPVDYEDATQIYMGQALARYLLDNSVNTIYFEASLAMTFLSAFSDVQSFALAGAGIGYMRDIGEQLKVGLTAGLDYGPRVADDLYFVSDAIYNKFAVMASYEL